MDPPDRLFHYDREQTCGRLVSHLAQLLDVPGSGGIVERVTELLADKARLDWADALDNVMIRRAKWSDTFGVEITTDGWMVEGRNVRKAIDAARQAQETSKP